MAPKPFAPVPATEREFSPTVMPPESARVPPEAMVIGVLLPRELLFVARIVPELILTALPKVLAPESVSVPVPFWLSARLDHPPLMTPDSVVLPDPATVRLLPLTLIDPESFKPPVPAFQVCEAPRTTGVESDWRLELLFVIPPDPRVRLLPLDAPRLKLPAPEEKVIEPWVRLLSTMGASPCVPAKVTAVVELLAGGALPVQLAPLDQFELVPAPAPVHWACKANGTRQAANATARLQA